MEPRAALARCVAHDGAMRSVCDGASTQGVFGACGPACPATSRDATTGASVNSPVVLRLLP